MRLAFQVLSCGLLLMAGLSEGTAENGRLLSTASLAKQVNTLGKLMADSPPGTTMESRRKAGFVLRDKIRQFVVDQIEANPDITREQLRSQLRAILSSFQYATCNDDVPPYVLANSGFGPKGRLQFAVAYQLSLGFMGPKGTITVLETYFVEMAKSCTRVRVVAASSTPMLPTFG